MKLFLHFNLSESRVGGISNLKISSIDPYSFLKASCATKIASKCSTMQNAGLFSSRKMNFFLHKAISTSKAAEAWLEAHRLPLPPEFLMCTRSTFAAIVLRLGSFVSLTLSKETCSKQSALLLPLALPLSTSAPGLVAVAALRRRSRENCTLSRPCDALGSSAQCACCMAYRSCACMASFSFSEVSRLYVGVRYVGIH